LENLISFNAGKLIVPENPVIPFIEGDGIGPDIWKATCRVLDGAVEIAYGKNRKIEWKEVLAGEKAFRLTGSWLPEETINAFQKHLVGIKGPLSTPVGGGIRSINVALRQKLDLFACVRPVRWFPGVPSPVRRPELIDVVIFRENTEDLYTGMEVESGSDSALNFIQFLFKEFGWRIREDSALGLKTISRTCSQRLIKAAFDHAIKYGRKSVTMVHKGNIQKYTEGAFCKWGYELARESYKGKIITLDECEDKPSEGQIILKDILADIFFQQILLRPEEFDVIATMNMNGDYISDAISAQVGGIGMAPGGNINYETGHAIFEATHGTAPKYAGLDVANPSGLILSGEMLFKYIGWDEAASLIVRGLEITIASRKVTYDLARFMEGATELKCSEFADNIIENMTKVG
jgi:isocitrate dehydrogenase